VFTLFAFIFTLSLIRGLETGGPLVGFGNYTGWGSKRYLHLELGAKSLRQQANLLNVNCYWYTGLKMFRFLPFLLLKDLQDCVFPPFLLNHFLFISAE